MNTKGPLTCSIEICTILPPRRHREPTGSLRPHSGEQFRNNTVSPPHLTSILHWKAYCIIFKPQGVSRRRQSTLRFSQLHYLKTKTTYKSKRVYFLSIKKANLVFSPTEATVISTAPAVERVSVLPWLQLSSIPERLLHTPGRNTSVDSGLIKSLYCTDPVHKKWLLLQDVKLKTEVKHTTFRPQRRLRY